MVSIARRINGPIVIGDDYTTQLGNAFVWLVPITEFTDGTPEAFFEGEGKNGTSWLVEGTITETEHDGDDVWQLTFELTAAITSQLSPGRAKWAVYVENESTEERVTKARGVVNVSNLLM